MTERGLPRESPFIYTKCYFSLKNKKGDALRKARLWRVPVKDLSGSRMRNVLLPATAAREDPVPGVEAGH